MTIPALPPAESLTVEFKSDQRKLADSELVAAVVCMTNAEGGDVWLGVEDDGTLTGLHPDHVVLDGLVGMIAARTSPSVQVEVSKLEIDGVVVAILSVPKASSPTATTSGQYIRRRVKHDGTPECMPLLPHDIAVQIGHLRLHDLSAVPVPGATTADLDPMERARLRRIVERNQADRTLLELDDDALDGALGFTQRQPDGSRLPTLTGLLMIGHEDAIRQFVPGHELAFQVMEGEEVLFNEFKRYPLLKLMEWVDTQFAPFNLERELQFDLLRVPIPKVDHVAFREAIANAVLHRDYTILAAVHIRIRSDELLISNPGGLVDGVTISNLLTTEPRPRYPCLADCLKRIGLVERTGRGVDAIYRGMLRFGRPEPDYGRTDGRTVVLQLAIVEADSAFLRFVLGEEGRRGGPLRIEKLIALSALREAKRMTAEELSTHIQRDASFAKRLLEAMVEDGTVQPHGSTPRTRSYTLSAKLYALIGGKAAFTRQAGFAAVQYPQMVINYVKQHGSIKRADVIELCGLTNDQAKALLREMKDRGVLMQHGLKRGAFYVLGPKSVVE